MRAESETNDVDVREGLASAYKMLVEQVSGLIARGQGQGVFKPHVSPEGGAWMFMAMGQIADLTHVLGMDGDQARECFSELGGLFWETLVTPEAMPRVQAIRQRRVDGPTHN
jgi:hypothetical protein